MGYECLYLLIIRNELRSLNKSVILVGNINYTTFDGKWIFPPQWLGYPVDDVKYFTAYPGCGGTLVMDSTNVWTGYQINDWTCFSGESQFLGPFYDGPTDMGLIIANVSLGYI
jgi:hypothetical protein